MSNCWMECLMNLSQRVNDNKCIPWNFPTIDDVTCKPRTSHYFMENFRFLDMSKVTVITNDRSLIISYTYV